MKETRGKFMEAYGEAYQKQMDTTPKKPPAMGGGAPTVAAKQQICEEGGSGGRRYLIYIYICIYTYIYMKCFIPM
jgi:hypothetical protein